MAQKHSPRGNSQLRYEVEDTPPWGLSSLLAAQTVLLSVASIILTPVIVLKGAGMDITQAPGIIFFALVVSGVTTMLQAKKVWRFGSGYILLMGTSGAFIAVGISALQKGGMPLMMVLITLSALAQFFFARHLSTLRRLITPLVGGTAIMLIAVTVMPIIFSHFPARTGDRLTLPAIALITLAAILIPSLFGRRQVKLWAPLMGVAVGTAAAWFCGEWSLAPVKAAAWFGLPDLSWPGFDLSFGKAFWVLLPAFIIITIVGAVETYGDAIAIQQISHKESKPVDFRAVQGALYTDGLGNLLSGILGTVPNTTYSTSISLVDMTGVAARRVGLICGILILALAFLPKVTALVLSIPQPVVGSYLLVLIMLLFIHGLKLVAEAGLNFENGIIVGMGFWLGTGFQTQAIFHALIPDALAPILNNGMTAGTLATILLSALASLNRRKSSCLKTAFSLDSLPGINGFIRDFSRRNAWPAPVQNRIQLAVEEVLISLLGSRSGEGRPGRTIRLALSREDHQVHVEIAALPTDKNMELLIDAARASENPAEEELSFRILGSLVTEFGHSQFHGTDFIFMKIRTGN